MPHPLRLAGAIAATVLAVLTTAACTASPTGLTHAAPDAVQPAGADPSSSPTAGPTSPVPSTATSSVDQPRVPECLGAVTYTIDAAEAGPVRSPRCLGVGALLRVTSHGPAGFSSGPLARVSCLYEGGVHECRLIRTGVATFTITRAGRPQSFTVVIAAASSSRPAPACLGVVTITINPSRNGPPWAALCVKKGAVLRVESFGPEGFSVDPRANVSCWYEAGVRECRFVKTGTVDFSMAAAELRTLTVVVID